MSFQHEYLCPECKGERFLAEVINGKLYRTVCWYCDGFGYATDEDAEEDIIRWE